MLSNTPSRQVKSVQTAFTLLDRLQSLGGATPTQLTEELDLSKSSIHNYLATLEAEGYVVNDDGTYRLGLRFLTHGASAKSVAGLGELAARTVARIQEELEQPTWWITEEDGRGYFLDCAVPDAATEQYGKVGKRSYLHTHAPGKAILAHAPDEYVERIADHHGLPELTPRTTTTLNNLREDLTEVRDRGFAISRGEAVLGILSIGVEFRDENDRQHAIGVFGHTRNFAGNRAENIGQQLIGQVRGLEQELQGES